MALNCYYYVLARGADYFFFAYVFIEFISSFISNEEVGRT